MKISEFLNEYDYQGETDEGVIFKVWKNPSPYSIRHEIGKLEAKGDYLRGAISDNGDFYVAEFEVEHIPIYYLLEKYGINAILYASLFKDGDVVSGGQEEETFNNEKLVKKIISMAQKKNKSFKFKMV